MENKEEIRAFLIEMTNKNERIGITKVLRRVEQKFNLSMDKETKEFVSEVLKGIRIGKVKKRARIIGFFTIAIGLLCILLDLFLFSSSDDKVFLKVGVATLSLGIVTVVIGKVPNAVDKDLTKGLI